MLDIIGSIGSIATPIILTSVGIIFWRYQKKIERRIKLEEQLRDDRFEIYNKILEPYIILFLSDKAWESDPKFKKKNKKEVAISKMLSVEYRKTSFRLALIGSDGVVKSHNELLQYFYNLQDNSEGFQLKEGIVLLGNFLLEIRKSMGNEATKINNIGMVEWFITDIRKVME